MTSATNQEDQVLQEMKIVEKLSSTTTPALTSPPLQLQGWLPRTWLPGLSSPSGRLDGGLQCNIPPTSPSRHWSGQHPSGESTSSQICWTFVLSLRPTSKFSVESAPAFSIKISSPPGCCKEELREKDKNRTLDKPRPGTL